MRLVIETATQQLYGTLRATVGRTRPGEDEVRDRGAVSLEQVLWFVAVGVSVAVVATILWSQVIDTASETDNIIQPTAP